MAKRTVRHWIAGLVTAAMTAVGAAQETYRPVLEDEAYRNACGPIAASIAARSLGLDVSLDTMIERCGWEPGQRITLEKVRDALADTPGLCVTADRLTPSELAELIADPNRVALLAVRKNGDDTDHAIVARTVEDGAIAIFDYPALDRRWSLDTLAESWDGVALVVTRGASPTIIDRLPVTTGLLGLLMLCVVVRVVGGARIGGAS